MSEAVIEIVAVDPRIPEAVELIHALSEELAGLYDYAADGSGNFRPEDVLVARSVFVIGRAGNRAVACGALRPLQGDVAEVKRMFVVPDCRGRGYSKAVLTALEQFAQESGYTTVHLETGERQLAAIRLYEQSGYYRIPNFGIYATAEGSVCFEKQLRTGKAAASPDASGA